MYILICINICMSSQNYAGWVRIIYFQNIPTPSSDEYSMWLDPEIVKSWFVDHVEPMDTSEPLVPLSQQSGAGGSWTCDKCDKNFTRKPNLLRHIKTCTRRSEAKAKKAALVAEQALLKKPIKKVSSWACDRCNKSYQHLSSLARHKERCSAQQCTRCGRVNSTRSIHTAHVKVCGQFQCTLCDATFSSSRELLTHQMRVHSPQASLLQRGHDENDDDDDPARQRSCRLCNCTFPNRRVLYLHQMQQHGGTFQEQTKPWGDGRAPWEGEGGDVDADMREVYNTNAAHILRGHQTASDVDHQYNFPTNDLSGGMDEVVESMKEIYDTSLNAFKINISFGIILRHRESGQYRYFIPYRNEVIFDSPFLISTARDLLRLRQKLEILDLESVLKKSRMDTKWEPVYVSNICIFATCTSYPLGNGILPQFVVKKMSIKCLEKAKGTNRVYPDNLCLFRCLAYHDLQADNDGSRFDDATLSKYLQFYDFMAERKCHLPIDPMEYLGLDLKQLPLAEECFEINIMVLELLEDDSIIPQYRTTSRHPDTVYLNLYEHHLSYVLDFRTYAKKFRCNTCSRHFPKMYHLMRHTRVCRNVTRYKFPGGHHKAENTVFDELEKLGIVVAEQDRFFPWFAVFDLEAMLLNHSDEAGTGKLKWTHTHQPVSFSVSANVEGFREAQCFVELDQDKLVEKLLDNLRSIREAVLVKAKEKWSSPIEKLQALMEKHRPVAEGKDGDDEGDDSGEAVEVNGPEEPVSREMVRAMANPNVGRKLFEGLANDEWLINYNGFDEDDEDVEDEEEEQQDPSVDPSGDPSVDPAVDEDQPLPGDVRGLMYRQVSRLYGRFMLYLSQLPVLGFNSSSYDINLIKGALIEQLGMYESTNSFVVKKSNNYSCISTDQFKFLDILQFVAPGTNYSKFLKAYGVEEKKGYMCYEWFDTPEKLELQELPPYEAFYSSLKMTNVLNEEFQAWEEEVTQCQTEEKKQQLEKKKPQTGVEKHEDIQKLWCNKNMTFRDYLKFYNNLDCGPFVVAIERLLSFYRAKNLDVFKVSISVPGLARKLLFDTAKREGVTFALFGKEDEDLYRTVKQNLTGGPSIVFNRHHQVGKDFIRDDKAFPVKKIHGYDSNALYLWSFSQGTTPDGSNRHLFRTSNIRGTT